MSSEQVAISALIDRLCVYTAQESGVAVLAHTDAGGADFYVDGVRHENALKKSAATGELLLRLRARAPQYYHLFELISPMPAELLSELAELYIRELQARFTPMEMDAVLTGAGV